MTLTMPLVVEEYEGIQVVRDDLLAGGTKQRVLELWLPEMGPAEYVYAGPREGYAQIALAEACRHLGKKNYKATIFVPWSTRARMHFRTQAAVSAGAQYCPVQPGYLSNVKAQAQRYVYMEDSKRLLPFGMDDPRFIEIMAEIAREIPEPPEFWVAAGSGTLCRALMRAWPNADAHGIQVGRIPYCGFATVMQAPERFQAKAKSPPPFPSCPEYDAKVWQFVKRYGKPGALMWNVAA